MPSYSSMILALGAAAVASPLAARSNVCGMAPTGSGTSDAPLDTFTNAQTADQCYDKCAANDSCKSFLFGLVDSTIKCELFDVPGAQIPKQDNADLVAFDKACTSIPDVKPTTANPQGLATGATDDSMADGQTSNTNTNTENQQQQTEGTTTQNTANKISQRNVAKASQKAEAKDTQDTEQKKTSTSSTCGATPAGSGNVQPFNTPANINSMDACITACKKNTSCKSVEFGKLTTNGANVCRFFSVEAAQIPKATAGQSFQVSDIACA